MAKDNTKINLKKLSKRITYSDIIKDTNNILREVSIPIPYPLSKEDQEIMNQMIDYVRSSQDENEVKERDIRPAYGISAIQLGHAKKMMYIRIESEFGQSAEEFALVNPSTLVTSKNLSYLNSGEGCLSVLKEHKGFVLRPYQIKVEAIDYFTGREIEIEAKGLTAIVLQHELDHLLGILFYDRINKLDPFTISRKAIKIS